MIMRVGRHLGRTLYRQRGAEPSDNDILVGMMDRGVDAALIVAVVNYVEAMQMRHGRCPVDNDCHLWTGHEGVCP